MKVSDAIRNRRSIRSYKPDQISDSDVQTVIEAALVAPNGRNAQEWHFSVIQNKDLLDRWFKTIKANVYQLNIDFLKKRMEEDADYNSFYRAPTVIALSGKSDATSVKVDCGASAENICLTAESLGLGSCVLGSPGIAFLTDEGKVLAREIGIPEGYEFICAVALGYAKGEKPVKPERSRSVINYVK